MYICCTPTDYHSAKGSRHDRSGMWVERQQLVVALWVSLCLLCAAVLAFVLSAVHIYTQSDVESSAHSVTNNQAQAYVKAQLLPYLTNRTQLYITDNDSQWRFRRRHQNSKSNGQASSADLLDCRAMSGLMSESSYATSGWTKSVHKVYMGDRSMAMKTVRMDSVHMHKCMLLHSHTHCYAQAASKLLKEIALLYELDDKHISQLLQSVAALLSYLSSSPFGSIAITDFRRQQFVDSGQGHLQLVDLDDLSLTQPSCAVTTDCPTLKGTHVLCVKGSCHDYNQQHNLMQAYSVFFSDLLMPQVPNGLWANAMALSYELTNQHVTANQLLDYVNALQLQYSTLDKPKPQPLADIKRVTVSL